MKECGKMIKLMAMVDSYIKKGMFMKGNGKLTKLMVQVSTFIRMEPNMKEVGFEILKKDKELKHGLIQLNILGLISKGKNKE